MMRKTVKTASLKAAIVLGGVAVIGLVACAALPAGPQNMSFFVTSKGPGDGGNLGGLEGADAHCQALATAVGAGSRTWHAYLSTQAAKLTEPAINARDRIGSGPWQNVQGVVVASSVEELHSGKNNINKQTALDENGNKVNGRGDTPNMHDMLTGSRPDGTAFPGAPFGDMTCGNWTKSGPDGAAMTGHHDQMGPIGTSWASSWNSTHPTLGCSPEKIRPTGGEGLFYCFAVK